MATTLPLAAGRVPPHDLDAEMSIIGSILIDPLSIAKVLQFLHPEDFYRENNGQVYRAALDLFAAGEPIDNVTLAAQLQTLGMLDRIGGGAPPGAGRGGGPAFAPNRVLRPDHQKKSGQTRASSPGAQISGVV